ncbi:hypothetical protein [Shewanella woodyi]|uniref:Lipoprotein n=1 Tax=Shewanella woodyi (strain ATCC 51908 / MS32) TaxID=392500 RepID=B1KI03_SHEWM|nr:hypothetical protein [Shewanella woodyi]ACA85481.1 conserved hypothetical protein [Shewanella woodyi ATCC 51908]
MNRSILIIKAYLLATLLSSCVPVPRDFYKPIYEEGTVTSSGCGGAGDPATILIQLEEGIEIKVRASSSDSDDEFVNFYVQTDISAPDGVVFQLANDSMLIEDNLTNKSWRLGIEYLSTNNANYLGLEDSIIEVVYPNLSQKIQAEIKKSHQDTGYIQVEPLSEIIGRTNSYDIAFSKKRYFNTGMWFSTMNQKMESKLENFSVYLPSIIVNGNKVDLGEIKFIHVKYIGIDPLNC